LRSASGLDVQRPTRLHPTFHEKIWGSTELEPWFPNAAKKIGEVWFGAEQKPPILAKLIFTSDKLSVQVHPPGKTEMWHILRAEPGARIALGFRQPLSREKLRQAAESGEIENLLNWLPVKAGETYFTPAGTVHAIGAGIALCEIQQNHLVTYRLYDYGRPRELHLDRAIPVSDLGVHPGASRKLESSAGRQLLVRCEYFETELLEAAGPEYSFQTDRGGLLIFLEGSGNLAGEAFRAGEAWLIPDGAWRLDGQTKVRALRVREPRP
jgi:mannose-6-phosphate isomerase